MTITTSPLHDWDSTAADGIRLAHPADWTVLRGELGTLVAVRATDASPDGFHANVSVVVRPSAEVDPDEILAAQLGELARLPDAILLDAEITELTQRPASRALVAYRSDDFELTLEQWILWAGGRMLTVSATSASSVHADSTDVLDAIIASFHLDA